MVIILIALTALFLWITHRNVDAISESLSGYFIHFFFGLVACIIPAGFLLSVFNLIGQPIAWGVAVVALSLLLSVTYRKISPFRKFVLKVNIRHSYFDLINLWKQSTLAEKLIFSVLGAGLVLVTVINLVILVFSYPNEWDSMTGHLVKCAYYIQHGNMGEVQATTWSVDFYPRSLTTLQIFFYHLLGEKGFNVIHYLSYWVFAVAVFGISRQLFSSLKASIFVFFMAALLPSALVQSVTTETDLVFTAYLSLVVYFVLLFCRKPTLLHAVTSGIMISVWMGHKVTFILVGPAMFIFTVGLLFWYKVPLKKLKPFVPALLLGIAVYVLPTGYIRNLREVGVLRIGALSAPLEVMKWHGIEDYSNAEKIKNLKLNIFRYSSDFLQLDGLRNTAEGTKVNNAFRYLPNLFFNRFSLERNEFWVVYPFKMMGDGPIAFFQERPYWGIISFGLTLPLIFIVFYRLVRKQRQAQLLSIFLVSGMVHFLCLCYTAPYDPIKGRYFMNMTVWFLPCLGLLFTIRPLRWYLVFCSVVVASSAFTTVSYRKVFPLTGEKNIFNMDRYEQMTIVRPEVYQAFKRFNELVPEDAVVALGTQQAHEDYEYPLWGKKLSRKMIPLHPFGGKVKPIPAEAGYLFYSKGVFEVEQGDIRLNEGDRLRDTPVPESEFYLRKLR